MRLHRGGCARTGWNSGSVRHPERRTPGCFFPWPGLAMDTVHCRQALVHRLRFQSDHAQWQQVPYQGPRWQRAFHIVTRDRGKIRTSLGLYRFIESSTHFERWIKLHESRCRHDWSQLYVQTGEIWLRQTVLGFESFRSCAKRFIIQHIENGLTHT